MVKKLPHFLDHGEHSCGFYRNEDEKLRIILPFLRAGLVLGEKCVLISSLSDLKAVKFAIRNSKWGSSQINEEQILHIDSSIYLSAFQSRDFMALGKQWSGMIEGFLAQGYQAIRGVGCLETEYSPELESFLLDYEKVIGSLFLQYPVSAICLYPSHQAKKPFGRQLLTPELHAVQIDPLQV